MRDMSMESVLKTPMGPNNAHAPTIRDYLMKLLITLWDKEEGFSGKRPFGNSGWKLEIYDALIQGQIENITAEEQEQCDRLINAAIRYMCK